MSCCCNRMGLVSVVASLTFACSCFGIQGSVLGDILALRTRFRGGGAMSLVVFGISAAACSFCLRFERLKGSVVVMVTLELGSLLWEVHLHS